MQDALTNFRTSLQRIRDLANDALANTAHAMKDSGLRGRHETALSAVVVTMSGLFESFLREVAEQYADSICQQNHPFGNLKPNIRHTHFQGGGKILSNVGGKMHSARYSWTTTNAADIAKRLASVDAGLPYELIWEAFAETGGNPGSSIIRDFLKRFGVTEPIKTLAANMKTTANTLSVSLDSFIAIRNECAHTGRATQTPTAVDVLSHCDLLEGIAAGIVSTLTAHQVC